MAYSFVDIALLAHHEKRDRLAQEDSLPDAGYVCD
jgi:hypothetical protein